jgi:hypothetical protein
MIPVNKKLLKLICMSKHVVLLHVHVKQLGAVYVRHTIKGTDIKETDSYIYTCMRYSLHKFDFYIVYIFN